MTRGMLPDELLSQLSTAIEAVVAQNEARGDVNPKQLQGLASSPFFCPNEPGIAIPDYVDRMSKYMRCTTPCFAIAAVYITRLEKFAAKNTDTPFVLSRLTAHRILLASMVVAIKFHDDNHHDNFHYAEVGGIALDEMNSLEAFLIKALDWRLTVSEEEYNTCIDALSAVRPECCMHTVLSNLDKLAVGGEEKEEEQDTGVGAHAVAAPKRTQTVPIGTSTAEPSAVRTKHSLNVTRTRKNTFFTAVRKPSETRLIDDFVNPTRERGGSLVEAL